MFHVHLHKMQLLPSSLRRVQGVSLSHLDTTRLPAGASTCKVLLLLPFLGRKPNSSQIRGVQPPYLESRTLQQRSVPDSGKDSCFPFWKTEHSCFPFRNSKHWLAWITTPNCSRGHPELVRGAGCACADGYEQQSSAHSLLMRVTSKAKPCLLPGGTHNAARAGRGAAPGPLASPLCSQPPSIVSPGGPALHGDTGTGPGLPLGAVPGAGCRRG